MVPHVFIPIWYPICPAPPTVQKACTKLNIALSWTTCMPLCFLLHQSNEHLVWSPPRFVVMVCKWYAKDACNPFVFHACMLAFCITVSWRRESMIVWCQSPKTSSTPEATNSEVTCPLQCCFVYGRAVTVVCSFTPTLSSLLWAHHQTYTVNPRDISNQPSCLCLHTFFSH